MSVEEMEEVISREYNPHIAPTGLVCMENTHNFAGGGVVSLENMAAVAELARKYKLPCHLDGARVLNAAIALDIEPQKIAEPFDSLTLCFSKGLGAPVGSVILGSKDFIHRCHRIRKMFGGGMRQAGILAAAAIYALENNVARLAEDHAAAQKLAEGIINLPGVSLPYRMPDSNILFFQCSHPKMPQEQIISELKERGILMGIVGGMIRAVTHLDVTMAEIEKTLDEVKELLGNR